MEGIDEKYYQYIYYRDTSSFKKSIMEYDFFEKIVKEKVNEKTVTYHVLKVFKHNIEVTEQFTKLFTELNYILNYGQRFNLSYAGDCFSVVKISSNLTCDSIISELEGKFEKLVEEQLKGGSDTVDYKFIVNEFVKYNSVNIMLMQSFLTNELSSGVYVNPKHINQIKKIETLNNLKTYIYFNYDKDHLLNFLKDFTYAEIEYTKGFVDFLIKKIINTSFKDKEYLNDFIDDMIVEIENRNLYIDYEKLEKIKGSITINEDDEGEYYHVDRRKKKLKMSTSKQK